ncbi:acyltransferase family protein [Pontibacter mangrovi]|nr:acyltransferase [Pontibacter mangrovi]
MRIKELDALRGFAAFGVFLFHFQLFDYGYLGVYLFFIISGFVIFLTANNVKTSSDFVISRFSRLYPAYWVCLALTFLVLLADGQGVTMKQLAYNLTMFQMFLGEKNVDGAYWSLTEELVFYVIVFGALVVGAVRRARLWGGLMLLAALGGLFLNPEVAMQKHLQDVVKYFGLFVAGIIFYQVYIGQKLKPAHGIGLLLCLAITTQYTFGKHLSYYNHTVEAVLIAACFGVFGLLVAGKLQFLSRYKWALFMGEISYPFYLLHQEIGLAFRRLFPTDNIWAHLAIVAAIFAGITLMAWLINYYVEHQVSRSVKMQLRAWNRSVSGALPFSRKGTVPLPNDAAAALAPEDVRTEEALTT